MAASTVHSDFVTSVSLLPGVAQPARAQEEDKWVPGASSLSSAAQCQPQGSSTCPGSQGPTSLRPLRTSESPSCKVKPSESP